ncbi:stage III sporulation protein SpoIIIAB [Lederbergia graminis]|uniref:Stage III sporulation protein SpoIIIAB n=1 Tax=Lederbergia graminis TaxID=735518 RepID=A0ABW0LCT2_9BACI|nr:stage III sporulation protein SpoIIIAB [Paenibacillus bovis]HLU22209.1 stage III sporulation protein SpoIIIAB [Bacillaceae bacterium]
MFKMIGAIFILAATTWAGFEYSKRLSIRPKQLQQFRNALETLEAEIMFGHTPLGEAARRISKQMAEPIASHFRLFEQNLLQEEITVKAAWEQSLKTIWKKTFLKQGEYEILLQFGENLGRHDRETEQKQIMLTLSHLTREEEGAREKQVKYEKMAKSFGILTGMLIVILLI